MMTAASAVEELLEAELVTSPQHAIRVNFLKTHQGLINTPLLNQMTVLSTKANRTHSKMN